MFEIPESFSQHTKVRSGQGLKMRERERENRSHKSNMCELAPDTRLLDAVHTVQTNGSNEILSFFFLVSEKERERQKKEIDLWLFHNKSKSDASKGVGERVRKM